MKYLIILAFIFSPLLALADMPPEKPNTVLIHPGEELYAKFEESGTALKVVRISKEKNAEAQLIMKMGTFDKVEKMLILKVESKFKQTMLYKAEMRLLSKNRRQETSVVPVLAGLSSYEEWPHPIEELALYGFTLKP